jgi:hypothetical protein
MLTPTFDLEPHLFINIGKWKTFRKSKGMENYEKPISIAM